MMRPILRKIAAAQVGNNEAFRDKIRVWILLLLVDISDKIELLK
jgi:hypothetical protein